VALALTFSAAAAEARPYRVIVTRTPRTTGEGNFEIGARYQGLFLGEGLGFDPGEFHQLAATLRWGIIDGLELDAEGSVILFQDPADPNVFIATAGDVRVAMQARVLRVGASILGVFAGLTAPTGPSEIDTLPPFFADGTLDGEILALYELAPTGALRILLDGGYVFQGTRDRGGLGDFDVPDALKYDVAASFAIGRYMQASLELNGRHYFDDAISPVWVQNADIIEVTPGFRVEVTPGLVFEAGAGIGLNDDTQAIYKLRIHAGLTYEFSAY
jgi:hypothetical protein